MASKQLRVSGATACLVTVKWAGNLVLAVLVSRDGSVNRMGNLSAEGDLTWYMGVTDEPLFDRFIEILPDDILSLAGRYEDSNRKGDDSEIDCIFSHPEGDVGFQAIFGSDDQNVPGVFMVMVKRAIEVTDDWWRAQPGQATVIGREASRGRVCT